MQMMNLTEHWSDYKREFEALQPDADGAVYLVSRDKRKVGVVGGRMSCNTRHVAALMLAQETHRLARPEEIAQWKAEQAELKRITEEKAAQRKAGVRIDLGDMLQQLMVKQATIAEPALAAQTPVAQLQRHKQSPHNPPPSSSQSGL